VRDRDREWDNGGALAADEEFAPPSKGITVVKVKRIERK
jgi:hypothetical protein